MKTFGTRGPVTPERHYVVPRTRELADFIHRVKEGRYVVIFAPRQTGKTTFFRAALKKLTLEEASYCPIELNFQVYKNVAPAAFYAHLGQNIREEIEKVFQKRQEVLPETLRRCLDGAHLKDHLAMLDFFKRLGGLLAQQRFVIIIDEFDGIPSAIVSDFLYSLRQTYHIEEDSRCPFSVSIVGVKNLTQLNYDRSISPFNIQDEFHLPNFTLAQVAELLSQYTVAVGQAFAPEVIETLHRQTAGQPFLVNRLGQILTEEMDIPKTEPILLKDFAKAHKAILAEANVNFHHVTTNIRKDSRFEKLLMKVATSEHGIDFNPHDELMKELQSYGVITRGTDGKCEIVNPIYQYCIMQAFKPTMNGLEEDYFPENTTAGFQDYLTAAGEIALEPLLDNFRDFIKRAGFRVLQVPNLPSESVGQHLLATYLDGFVKAVGGFMYLEVPTGRGQTDLIILHRQRKYIVETKVWGGAGLYEAGKKQLVAYLRLEGAVEGYYIVFDHRKNPEPRVETEAVNGMTIRSYVIPVLQERPSDAI